MSNTKPTILIIIGVTGDLSRRYLLKAITQLAKANAFPEKFRILGTTRQNDMKLETLLGQVVDKDYLLEHGEIIQLDVSRAGDYSKLQKKILEIERKIGPAQHLFYLSVPPLITQEIIYNLGSLGLNTSDTKLLLEKPFGTDLTSTQKQAEQIDQYFKADQVYRIDHYLAKETAQNILVFREHNTLFHKTWNKDFIGSIEILATEQIDIEGRANFYEQTGALRDIVQNHLLQLAALTLMDLPEGTNTVPNNRLAALKDLSVVKPIDKNVRRAQYLGYKETVRNPKSQVETYANITLESKNPQWLGVPITLITGKALDKKTTQIRVNYICDSCSQPDQLILKLQPDEGIEIDLWAKKPGYDNQTIKHQLSFSYQKYYQKLPEAYEHILLDAINSDHELFTTSQEVLESWRIIDPVQQFWQSGKQGLYIYPKGSTPEEIAE